MNKMEFNIKVNNNIKEIIEKQYNMIITNEYGKDIIDRYSLNEEEVYNNTSKITDWIKEKESCANCKGLKYCNKKTNGRYMDLKYDKILVKELSRCEYLIKEDKAIKHKEYFRNSHISDNMLKIDLTKIDVAKESKTYRDVLAQCIKFMKEPQKGLMLYGAPGVGKSFLSMVIANDFAKNKKSVSFINMPTFMNELKMNLYNKNYVDSVLSIIKNVDLLIIDDIGGEVVSSWSRDEILLPILNERMEMNKLCIVTSNYSIEQLQKHYIKTSSGDMDNIAAIRLIERLKALCNDLEVISSNRRT